MAVMPYNYGGKVLDDQEESYGRSNADAGNPTAATPNGPAPYQPPDQTQAQNRPQLQAPSGSARTDPVAPPMTFSQMQASGQARPPAPAPTQPPPPDQAPTGPMPVLMAPSAPSPAPLPPTSNLGDATLAATNATNTANDAAHLLPSGISTTDPYARVANGGGGYTSVYDPRQAAINASGLDPNLAATLIGLKQSQISAQDGNPDAWNVAYNGQKLTPQQQQAMLAQYGSQADALWNSVQSGQTQANAAIPAGFQDPTIRSQFFDANGTPKNYTPINTSDPGVITSSPTDLAKPNVDSSSNLPPNVPASGAFTGLTPSAPTPTLQNTGPQGFGPPATNSPSSPAPFTPQTPTPTPSGGSGIGAALAPAMSPNTAAGSSPTFDVLNSLISGASGKGAGSAVQSATQQKALDLLNNPSPYGSQDVKNLYSDLGGNIDDQFNVERQQLGEEMAKRGLGTSTIYGGRLNDLNIGQRTAKEELAKNLATNYAQTLGNYQQGAVNTGNTVGTTAQNNSLGWLSSLMGYGQNAFNNDVTTNALNQNATNNYQNYILQLLGLGYGGSA